jgi:hypothetical protein
LTGLVAKSRAFCKKGWMISSEMAMQADQASTVVQFPNIGWGYHDAFASWGNENDAMYPCAAEQGERDSVCLDPDRVDSASGRILQRSDDSLIFR